MNGPPTENPVLPASATQARAAERYAVLLDLARALASTLVPGELYAAVHRHITRVLPVSGFAVSEWHTDGGPVLLFHEGDVGTQPSLPTADLDHLRSGDFVRTTDDDGRLVLAAPLLRDERLFGYIALFRHRGGPFDADDAHFLLAVGQLAGVALDNARLFERQQRRSEEAERLENIARDLSGTLDLDAVTERIAEHAHSLSGAPAVVWLRDGELIRAIARAGGALVRLGEERSLPKPLATAYGTDLAGAWRTLPDFDEIRPVREPIRGTTADPIAECVPEPEQGRVLIPLALGDRLVAVLAVGVDGKPDAERFRMLGRMAALAASAVENARLHAQVRRLSLTDPLLQIPNRRQLDLFLAKEFAAAQRGRDLSFVLYDLDHFKEYNDKHGHRAGDIALIRFAEALQHETRAMNLAARYGGEEFATVLSDTGEGGGRAHAERVRRRAEALFDGRLTVSAGVAVFTDRMQTPIDLVVAADGALYRAKLDGRNRVYVAGE